VTLKLDKLTNRIATPACPDDYYAAFLAGTEPKDTCEHVTDNRNLIQKIFGLGEKPSPPPAVSNQQPGAPSNQPGPQQHQPPQPSWRPQAMTCTRANILPTLWTITKPPTPKRPRQGC